MNTIRAFLAIETPIDIQINLKNIIARLNLPANHSVRWVKADNIHLTLKFYGETPKEKIELLVTKMQQELKDYLPMQLTVSGIGAFPNLSRPRVFWCGIQAGNELVEIQKRIDSISSAFGFPQENRPFSPHLTLGRVNDRAEFEEVRRVSELIRSSSVETIGAIQVSRLTIFSSKLSPGGSIYSPVFHINLKDPSLKS